MREFQYKGGDFSLSVNDISASAFRLAVKIPRGNTSPWASETVIDRLTKASLRKAADDLVREFAQLKDDERRQLEAQGQAVYALEQVELPTD